ncbi:hypothetical protein G8759_27340 [Spirosoma aureum]|uniref:Uncharacterized protein n=1 Tax=Spirosoma aureum TaxID=2692134 RepID=A0A6G9AUR1_9BACT|nr:hypothetical protein [Spirosoma aureum]QIP16084.1 hypothetical protein G8759_27340 [Spirosoma aureum]
MRIALLIISTGLFFGCQDRSSQESASTSSAETAVAADTLCFQQILKRDTTTIQLIMNGTKATGYLDINPYEKDRARGPIQGTIKGNQIEVNWDRSGEGVVQRYTLDLHLKADAITWHEGERVKKQGVWVLKQPTRGYEYVLNKTNCP